MSSICFDDSTEGKVDRRRDEGRCNSKAHELNDKVPKKDYLLTHKSMKRGAYKLFLEYAIASGLHNAAGITNRFYNATQYQTTSKSAPNIVSNCEVELNDGENDENCKIKGVGTEVGYVMVPPILLDTTSSHSTETAVERHVESCERV